MCMKCSVRNTVANKGGTKDTGPCEAVAKALRGVASTWGQMIGIV